tara:strand:+ start:164 stop:640 length:477 start_codon:yes stop_codon:yes gene_type:complete
MNDKITSKFITGGEISGPVQGLDVAVADTRSGVDTQKVFGQVVKLASDPEAAVASAKDKILSQVHKKVMAISTSPIPALAKEQAIKNIGEQANAALKVIDSASPDQVAMVQITNMLDSDNLSEALFGIKSALNFGAVTQENSTVKTKAVRKQKAMTSR